MTDKDQEQLKEEDKKSTYQFYLSHQPMERYLRWWEW